MILTILVYSEQKKEPAGTETGSSAVVKEKAVKVTDTLVVNAKLIEIPGKFPANDIYDYVYIMKYRITNVVKGSYSEKEILVGQYNPLIARNMIKDEMDQFVNGTVKAFKIGDNHTLKLVSPMETVWKDAVEDEYFDSDLPKFFAIQTDLVTK
jgi:hypothetical protein